MYKCLRSKKGASLIIVLMVTAVIFTLGVTILGVGVAEARISTRQVNRTQAYLSAKSGVEICLKKIKDKLATGNYEDVATLYSDINTQSDVSIPDLSGSVSAGEDSYKVWFVDGGLVAQNRIKIYGEALANNVKGTTALTIEFTSPDRIPLEWLNPGQIIIAGNYERTTGPVVVDVAKLLGHSPKKSTNNVTSWKAPSIHFVDNDGGFSLEVTSKQLILQSNLISFRKKIYTKYDNDCLVLKTYTVAGFKGPGGVSLMYDNTNYIPDGWGVVVLYDDMVKGNNKNSGAVSICSPGYYIFAPGMALSLQDDRDPTTPVKFLKITNQSTIDYIEAIIRSETAIGFEPTQIRWSNN